MPTKARTPSRNSRKPTANRRRTGTPPPEPPPTPAPAPGQSVTFGPHLPSYCGNGRERTDEQIVRGLRRSLMEIYRLNKEVIPQLAFAYRVAVNEIQEEDDAEEVDCEKENRDWNDPLEAATTRGDVMHHATMFRRIAATATAMANGCTAQHRTIDALDVVNAILDSFVKPSRQVTKDEFSSEAVPREDAPPAKAA